MSLDRRLVLALALVIFGAQVEPRTAPTVQDTELRSVKVSAQVGQCQRADVLELWWIGRSTKTPSQPIKRSRGIYYRNPPVDLRFELVAESAITKDCRWSFNGLVLGTYLVALRGPDGSMGSRDFELTAASEAIPVDIPEPTVRASGHLLFSDLPIADAHLEFVRIPSGDGIDAITTTKTDGVGQYTVRLNRPGKYLVLTTVGANPPLVGPNPMMSVSTQFTIGDNSWDLVHKGTALAVRIHTRDEHLPTTVIMRRGESAKIATVEPGDHPVAYQLNIDYGEYQVLAYQRSGRVSVRPTTLTINQTNEVATVDVQLVNNQSTLSILDGQTKQPVSALVTGWSGERTFPSVRVLSPATYDLSSIPPGTEIRIQPRDAYLVPSCRTVGHNEQATVLLKSGRVVDAIFERRGVAGPGVGLLIGVESSNCPVPLSFFAYKRMFTPPGAAARGTFQNFPLSRQLFFNHADLIQPVSMPDDSVVIFK